MIKLKKKRPIQTIKVVNTLILTQNLNFLSLNRGKRRFKSFFNDRILLCSKFINMKLYLPRGDCRNCRIMTDSGEGKKEVKIFNKIRDHLFPHYEQVIHCNGHDFICRLFGRACVNSGKKSCSKKICLSSVRLQIIYLDDVFYS